MRREGTDVVVITWGALVQRALLAAQQAEKEGFSVAVFDLRTIIPYDWAGISALVQKTNRVIVAHEDQLTCGFGAEIAARIADELFHSPGRADPARRGARLSRSPTRRISKRKSFRSQPTCCTPSGTFAGT